MPCWFDCSFKIGLMTLHLWWNWQHTLPWGGSAERRGGSSPLRCTMLVRRAAKPSLLHREGHGFESHANYQLEWWNWQSMQDSDSCAERRVGSSPTSSTSFLWNSVIENNILREKDLKRQNEIIEHLHCEYWRYNEKMKQLWKVE